MLWKQFQRQDDQKSPRIKDNTLDAESRGGAIVNMAVVSSLPKIPLPILVLALKETTRQLEMFVRH